MKILWRCTYLLRLAIPSPSPRPILTFMFSLNLHSHMHRGQADEKVYPNGDAGGGGLHIGKSRGLKT